MCIIINFPVVFFLQANIQELYENSVSQYLPVDIDPKILSDAKTIDKLTSLAKTIHKAKKHVRGSKTSDYLIHATLVMNSILKDLNISTGRLYERSSVAPKSVCTETYKGGSYGFPMYYKGFETDQCGKNVTMSSLVTVVKYFRTKLKGGMSLATMLDKFITSVYDVVKDIKIIIAVDSATFPDKIETKHKQVSVQQAKFQSDGAALNQIIKQVKTPYVLVARSLNILTLDSRLERLIREIESLNAAAAGGAIREMNGHWWKGCYQSAYKNYTLKYLEGYDESFHECLFCDYIEGPFVTTTEYFKQNNFETLNENNGLYEDWFLRTAIKKRRETIVCPDSMFHVNNEVVPNVKPNWDRFSQIWNLVKVQTPKGITVTKTCPITKPPSSRASYALSPCTLQVNSEAAKVFMKTCESTGNICEFQAGTLVGAVKLGKTLPWEYDFDVRVLSTNVTQCKLLVPALKKAGFGFPDFQAQCGKTNLKDGMFHISLNYRGYMGDLHGIVTMDSGTLIKSGSAPTKALFNGQWVNVPRNPAMFVRNNYGNEIFQHAEHWRYTNVDKMNTKRRYKTNTFLPCKRPGSPDCLDRYNADGDLPFIELIP